MFVTKRCYFIIFHFLLCILCTKWTYKSSSMFIHLHFILQNYWMYINEIWYWGSTK